MLYEYEVFTSTSDTKIFTGDINNPKDIDNKSKWRDWDGDILIDVLWAENEEEAVKAASEKYDMHESALYAVQHIASAVIPDSETRIEASSFAEDKQAGIAVTVKIPGMDQDIRVVTDGERITAYSNTEKDMYQVLSWNDEYLSMAIESSPVDFGTAIKIMRARTVARLVELNVAENLEAAEKMYDDASSDDPDKDTSTLSVCPCYEASIRYGGGYEERHEIIMCPKAQEGE